MKNGKLVVILGASGNLGGPLVDVATSRGWDVVVLSSREFDPTTLAPLDVKIEPQELVAPLEAAIKAKTGDRKIDLLINAAAMNDVDGAEGEKRGLSHRLNVALPWALGIFAASRSCAFVHYSTDYVFDGEKPDGYAEHDEPKPISNYGHHKRAGEVGVLQAGMMSSERSVVIRTSKLFGPPGSSAGAKPSFATNAVKWAMGAHASKPAPLIAEEIGCPTYTVDLAEATFKLVDDPAQYPGGIYHLVNEDSGVTWAQFAEEVYEVLGIDPPRHHVPSSALKPRAANRPQNSTLLNTKGPKLPSRLDALKRFFSRLTIELTGIPGLVVVTPNVFKDDRGAFSEPFNRARFGSFGLPWADVQQNDSFTVDVGTLRGLHFQKPPYAQGKIVRCAYGRVLDLVVDIRKGSPTYGQCYQIELTRENGKILIVPPGFAHGYLTLEPNSLFQYVIFGAGWSKESEGGLMYNDPAFTFDLPEGFVNEALLKPNDRSWPAFATFETPFN